MKLLAKSTHEKHFLSCMLQNSIFYLDSTKQNPGSLMFTINRFCWEKYFENQEPVRCISELKVSNMNKIFCSKIEKQDFFLNLISLLCLDQYHINLIFSNHFEIKLQGQDLCLSLEDKTDTWYTDNISNNYFKDIHYFEQSIFC